MRKGGVVDGQSLVVVPCVEEEGLWSVNSEGEVEQLKSFFFFFILSFLQREYVLKWVRIWEKEKSPLFKLFFFSSISSFQKVRERCVIEE